MEGITMEGNEVEGVKILPISQLLQTNHPLTGASSLNPTNTFNFINPNPKPKKLNPNNNTFTPTPPTLTNPSPKVIKPLNHPTVLIGTITLPSNQEDPSISTTKPNCFSFSDDSATVSCDILDFELRVIGKRINVLAWNFIPLNCDKGHLEIIRWSLQESTSGLRRCSSNSDAYSLSSGSACKTISKYRYSVLGRLESVSPVSVIPGDNFGFLTQILVVDSKSSDTSDSPAYVIVYLGGSVCSWHPVFSRLIGNVVSFSGLKKKLVFIGKLESKLMYVTTEEAQFHLPIVDERCFAYRKTNIERPGGFGVYTGIVTGVYMLGMVVELDDRVLLLLTDQKLTTPLSMRIGSIVSVRNVHIVNPLFPWTKVLVLGACCKTSICVKSFSPMETGCHIFSRSRTYSHMWKYINSLEFSARLWALLVISCFGKKFSVILSEKQIFGTKHVTTSFNKIVGLTRQKDLLRNTRLHVYLYQPSVFGTEYLRNTATMNHVTVAANKIMVASNWLLIPFFQAVPFSNFINHCEATWMKLLLEQKSDSDLIGKNTKYGFLSCEGKYHAQSIRRVLRSEEMDVVLTGKLQISPYSRKLQLVDATGSIDVVIPEFRSTWHIESIYEVNDFIVVMEGIPEQSDCSRTPLSDLFSCRNIFNNVPLVRGSNVAIYLYFHLRDEVSRNRRLCPSMDWKANADDLGSGTFHIIYVTHKLPMLQKDDQVVSYRSSVFAEAIILPWDLFISKIDGDSHPSSKRCKTDFASSGTLLNSCDSRYTYEISCFVTGKSVNGHCPACSETLLSCRKADLKVNCRGRHGSRKVLLEFESDSFCKYEMLKIGGLYITENHHDLKCDKLVITAKIHMWSVLFSSDEVIPKLGQSIIPPFKEDSSSLEIEQDILRFSSADPQFCSDRCVFLSANDLSFLKALKEGLIEARVSLGKVNNMLTAAVEPSGTSNSCLPKGKLISLKGCVVGIQDSIKSYACSHLNEESYCGDDSLKPKIFGVTSNVCIHVLVDNSNVRIYSSISKNTYPTGFGPGVEATFHRILVRGENEFTMTVASFIVINSIKIANENCSSRCENPFIPLALQNITTPAAVPAALISELIQCSESKPMDLRCQVVGVYVLVLEQKATSLIDIPLAGFILDDGSSSCCCWANSTSAATLLRLHGSSPITHHLNKILKQHQRIVIKNYGIVFDSLGQDLRIFYGWGNNRISVSDEELLKSVVLNSCFSRSWSVVGGIMDWDGMGVLKEQLVKLKMTIPHQLKNIWAIEVVHFDPLKKARSVIEELLKS